MRISNDDVYATGLLTRALDPATQPPEIQAYLRAEFELLEQLVTEGMHILDVGCGTGGHLLRLKDRLGFGLGVEYEHRYVVEAARRAGDSRLLVITCEETAIPISSTFDFGICLTNTWGTMSDKLGVMREMRRLAPKAGSRLLSVYSRSSVPARREWYRRLDHTVLEETSDHLVTEGGFHSEHFSEPRLRALVGDSTVRPLSEIAYAVTF